jgi:RNA polymerase sigma-70 factor (ECF subfamily)
MTADSAQAEDLLQESFVTVFRQIGTFRGESTPGAWIRKIVINHCLSYLRRKAPVMESITDPLTSDIPDEVMDEPWVTPELVQQCIRELPDGARSVFVMYQMEGYRHQDIARMLGISESTSKSQYQRAKSLLKEKILATSHGKQV